MVVKLFCHSPGEIVPERMERSGVQGRRSSNEQSADWSTPLLNKMRRDHARTNILLFDSEVRVWR
jgi:hypothetical protein